MPKITFTKSNTTIDFDGTEDSILEASEAAGLDLEFGCRMGNCTACQQTILSGEVDYPEEPSGEPEAGSALLCCCIPKGDVVIDA